MMILNKIYEVCANEIQNLLDNFTEMHSKMSIFPKNEKELVEMKNFIMVYRKMIEAHI